MAGEEMIELLAGERAAGESNKAVQACNDYLRMGTDRSLAKLLGRYQDATETPPTKRIKTLKDWSRNFGWFERSSLYDGRIEAEKTRQHQEKIQEIIQEGAALPHERVRRLKDLEALLWDQIHEKDDDGRLYRLWCQETKGIGAGDNFQTVKVEQFNAALIHQYRGVLDDIAKETGGRSKTLDRLIKVLDFSKLSDEQLEKIEHVERAEDVINVLFGSS